MTRGAEAKRTADQALSTPYKDPREKEKEQQPLHPPPHNDSTNDSSYSKYKCLWRAQANKATESFHATNACHQVWSQIFPFAVLSFSLRDASYQMSLIPRLRSHPLTPHLAHLAACRRPRRREAPGPAAPERRSRAASAGRREHRCSRQGHGRRRTDAPSGVALALVLRGSFKP